MDTTIIEIVLGLVLIYALLAALVMKLQDLLASSFLRYRAGTAHDLLLEAVGEDETLKERLLKNPLIFALFKGQTATKHAVWIDSGPTVVPPDLFSRALLIELNAGTKGGQAGEHPSARHATPSAFLASEAPAGAGKASGVWGSLSALLPGREGSWVDFEAAIGRWFIDIGDRSEGWFKRRATVWTLVLSLACAALLNVDTAHIARTLSSDPQLRVGLANVAERVEAQRQADAATAAGTPAAPANLPTRPEVQVSVHMTDAITQLTSAFVRDKAVGLFRANLIQVSENCPALLRDDSRKEQKTGQQKESQEQKLAGGKLSDSDVWVQLLPVVLARIETAPLEPASSASTYQASFRCVAHISAWVKSAVTASVDPDVRKAMQDAAVALELVKSNLLRLIEQQAATLSLRRTFLAEPELFTECADDAKSRGEFDSCLRRELSLTLKLPMLHGGQNSRRQFCKAVNDVSGEHRALAARHVQVQVTQDSGPVQVIVGREERADARRGDLIGRVDSLHSFCDWDFKGSAALGLPAMHLTHAGGASYVSWFFGVLVTAIFVSLGAPFWFDILSKVVKLRAAGRSRDDADDEKRGRGTLPLPAVPPGGASAPAPAPVGPAGPGTGPFPDARNGFEDKLVAADVVRLQQKLGAPTTGRLDGPTRAKIKEASAQFGTPTEDLNNLLFEAIVGRSATHATPIDLGSRLQRGATNERVSPLAKALMKALKFDDPARIAPSVTTFDDDLRALAVLYRYKQDTTAPPRDRAVFALAGNNPRALDEVDEALIDSMLRNSKTFDREEQPWLDWAIGELGQVEIDSTRRADSNPRICAYLDKGLPGSGDGGDHTPWCAAFTSWVLGQYADTLAAGDAKRTALDKPAKNPLLATSWALWGNAARGAGASGGAATADAKPGDIVLFKADPARPEGSGHVAFYFASDANQVWVLGGNQSKGSRVSLTTFPVADIVTIRAAV